MTKVPSPSLWPGYRSNAPARSTSAAYCLSGKVGFAVVVSRVKYVFVATPRIVDRPGSHPESIATPASTFASTGLASDPRSTTSALHAEARRAITHLTQLETTAHPESPRRHRHARIASAHRHELRP